MLSGRNRRVAREGAEVFIVPPPTAETLGCTAERSVSESERQGMVMSAAARGMASARWPGTLPGGEQQQEAGNSSYGGWATILATPGLSLPARAGRRAEQRWGGRSTFTSAERQINQLSEPLAEGKRQARITLAEQD